MPAPLGLQDPVRGVQQPGTDYPGPIIYYPQPYVNASNSRTSGYDAALHIEVPAGAWGKVTFSLDANYVIASSDQNLQSIRSTATRRSTTPAPPVRPAVGGAVGTPRTRGSFTTDWTRGPLSIGQRSTIAV